MIRKIIKIDEEKCNGCGICAKACHEGAIAMVDGKAKLIRDDYCDGLGDCLPQCPCGAISFEEREAAPYDEKAVLAARQNACADKAAGSCPGSASMPLAAWAQDAGREGGAAASSLPHIQSRLGQWPCQIKLAPVNAPYFDGARLLIAADCTAYVYGDFHRDFMEGRITLIGCPKLDAVDYSEKLTQILMNNDIKALTVLRMEVPCCCGMELAVKKALQNSKKVIPWQVVTLSVNGQIKED